MLQSLPGLKFHCMAQDSAVDHLTRRVNISFPEDHLKTGRLMKNLKLKIGTRVMLTNNIDLSDGLTNGAMGTMRHVAVDEKNTPTVILVHFDNI